MPVISFVVTSTTHHHHRVLLITGTKPAPTQTSRSICCRHINNSSPSCSTDHKNETSPPRTSRSIFCQHINNSSTIHNSNHHHHHHHHHFYITLTFMCTGSEKCNIYIYIGFIDIDCKKKHNYTFCFRPGGKNMLPRCFAGGRLWKWSC